MSNSLLIGIWWHLPPYRLSTDREVVAPGPVVLTAACNCAGCHWWLAHQCPGTRGAPVALVGRPPVAPGAEEAETLVAHFGGGMRPSELMRVQPVWLQTSRDRKSLNCRRKALDRRIGPR